MKTLIFLFLFLGVSGSAFCHPIDMDAIQKIETGGEKDPDKAVGTSGEIGRYQISPIVLKHFNQTKHGSLPSTRPSFIGIYIKEDLSESVINQYVANWYMNWLFDRCWTVKDTLIAWNWGIGNWREWKETKSCHEVFTEEGIKNHTHEIEASCIGKELPKTTQEYLKKYEKLTGETL